MSEEEEEVVNAGWVSLSRSGKSLNIRVLNQMFFVSLRDLRQVLDKERRQANVKQWVKRGSSEGTDSRRREGWVGERGGARKQRERGDIRST